MQDMIVSTNSTQDIIASTNSTQDIIVLTYSTPDINASTNSMWTLFLIIQILYGEKSFERIFLMKSIELEK